MAEHMSAKERHDHYKAHNHRHHEPHHREAAAKMDTRKMQVGRHVHKSAGGKMKGLHY